MFYIMCINFSLQKVFSFFHPLTSEVPVRSRVRSCEICCRPSGTRTGFLLVIQFSMPVTFQYHCKTTLTGESSGRSLGIFTPSSAASCIIDNKLHVIMCGNELAREL